MRHETSNAKILKGTFLWITAALVLLLIATPALSAMFAADDSVRTRSIVKGAVTSAKIRNGTIKGEDIANRAVTVAKIAGGSGSGLDADKIDGRHSTAFVTKTGDQSINGKLIASDFSYDTTKTGYFTVPAAALIPNGANSKLALGPAIAYGDVSGTSAGFHAPVNLPQGAVVTDLQVQYFDNHTDTLSVELTRYSNSGSPLSSITQMANVVSGAPEPAWKTMNVNTISSPVIDNSSYAYYIYGNLSNAANTALIIGATRITYQYSSPAK